jgi:hypothetical protein
MVYIKVINCTQKLFAEIVGLGMWLLAKILEIMEYGKFKRESYLEVTRLSMLGNNHI